MFRHVLIANRGAAAARILRAVKQMGLTATVVHAEVDRDLPYVADADHAMLLPGKNPRASYLDSAALLAALRESGADALHPGYGFLSENAEFARQVENAGVSFIGPAAQWIETMGHKTQARELMERHGLPVTPGTAPLGDNEAALHTAAEKLGYPVLVKPAGGGGGIGMLPVHEPQELVAAVSRARQAALRSFGVSDVYLEPYLQQPRHIEFQVLADNYGKVKVLGVRDCSVQRRHQKVVEEAPPAALDPAMLGSMARQVESALSTMGYNNIGTVEMLLEDGIFHFLEMNTRLQVEHAVTEAVTGLDLVKAQIQLAAGLPLDDVLAQEVQSEGCALEARIYAEDPISFLPSPGPLTELTWPDGANVRVESGYAQGNVVTPWFDPMIGKLVVWAPTRDEALTRLRDALQRTRVAGIKTNIPFLLQLLQNPQYAAGQLHTQITPQVVAALKQAQSTPTAQEKIHGAA